MPKSRLTARKIIQINVIVMLAMVMGGCGPGDTPGLDSCLLPGSLPPRTFVFHVTRRRPEYIVCGVRIESLQRPDSYRFAITLKFKFRDLNEASVGDAASNVLLVRASPLGGRRNDGIDQVLQDLASYWLIARWPRGRVCWQ